MSARAIFGVFLWKNWLYLRFYWLSFAIITAGCLGVISVYLHSTYKVESTPQFIYDSKNGDLLKEYFPANDGDYLYFTPNLSEYDDLMEKVRQELQLPAAMVRALENSTEMQQRLEHNCEGKCFGVQFKENSENKHSLNYAISSTEIRSSAKKRYVNDEDIIGLRGDDDYIRTGFLTLQHIIDKSFIQLHSSGQDAYDIEIATMPSSAHNDMDGKRMIQFGSIYSILFGVLLLSTFIVPLVEEKQDGLKEFLIIATPLNFLNGVCFFLVRFIIYFIFMLIAFSTASIYTALGVAPLFYVALLFVLYMLSAMSYAYLISVCFHSVFYAKVGGLLLLIIPYIFYLVKGGFSTAATYVFSTKTFLEGLETLQIFTNKHRVFAASDLLVNITDSSFCLFTIYGALITQSILYSILYNYLSNVFPGPGGIRKSFLFCLNPNTYKKQKRNEYKTGERGSDAIIIQDLDKSFKTPTREIRIADKLNMAIKNKQITVLLGHNGAGKTTTLNMIMGSEPYDGGKITVCSERDVSSYRHLIGFCPQHSVFMNYMTCTQHLQFFALLRECKDPDLADRLLLQLKLTDKANEVGRNLSGGMKRRLSLGIALAGDTKVVVLDEPSSGLDIESRREMWDILLELRRSKAILVTTHHMDEAEILGDTICILAKGRLQRTGSPLELKRKVGTGYILKLCTDMQQFKQEATMELIQRHVPTANVLNYIAPTLLISLPYNYVHEYAPMLKDLEATEKHLGIQSISITDTSLEDVFLNCANSEDQVDGTAGSNNSEKTLLPYERLTRHLQISWLQQFNALVYKKYVYLKSEWLYTLIMLCLPFLCAAFAIFLMHSMSIVEADDELHLSLKNIKEGIVYVHASDASTTRFEQILIESIQKHDIQVQRLSRLNETAGIAKALIELQEQNLAHFLQNVVGLIHLSAGEGTAPTYEIYFSSNIYHSSTILLNLLENAILKSQTNNAASIETTYLPIRRFITDVSPTRLEYYAVIVPIGMFFCMFFYVSLPFREHSNGFKQLQAVPRITYWASTYVIDLLLHGGICILLFVFQMLIMPKTLYSLNDQIIIVSSIFFYGCSYLPILYAFANSLRSISTISTYLLFMLIISAIAPLITSVNLKAIQDNETLIMFLSILPDFNLNHQLRIVNENFSKPQLLLGTGAFFGFAIFTFAVSMLFFINIIENMYKRQSLANLFNCYSCRQINLQNKTQTRAEEESLVQQEKAEVDDIIQAKKQDDYPLLVSDLYKFYDGKPAVCGINFMVRKRECFGLLGVNGAGKTSTFQMITANSTISSGNASIDGASLLCNEINYRYLFGYCPQYDCLNNFMTAYEVLKYMAMLRGLSASDIHNEILFWLEQLKLEKYAHIEIRHYSGGTKRKLNTALAMIGSPSLVMLDEPTTGVDPKSRRALWKCIQDFQKRDKTVVLTSHSMDECEQLCNRLSIMANGKFKCIGNIPDLKQRYGTGFTIKVKLTLPYSDSNIITITEAMRDQFALSELRENHAGMLTYLIKSVNHENSKILWSEVFRQTQKFIDNCEELVEEYSVNESTLEDIFLRVDTRNRIKFDELPVQEV